MLDRRRRAFKGAESPGLLRLGTRRDRARNNRNPLATRQKTVIGSASACPDINLRRTPPDNR